MVEHSDTSRDTNSGKGGHPMLGWSDVADDAARAALVQVIGNVGIVVRQTGGIRPGFYALNGVTGQSTYLNEPVSSFETGWISGLTASINTDTTKFDLTSGFIRVAGVVELVAVPGGTGLDPANLVTEDFTIILADAAGDLVLINTAPTDEILKTHAQLQTLQHVGAVINGVDSQRNPSEHISAALIDQSFAGGPINEGNNYLQAGNDSTLKKLEGVTRRLFLETVNSLAAPNRQANFEQDPVAFPAQLAFQSIRDGSGDHTISPFTALPVGFWDNNLGVLSATPKFVIHRADFFNNVTVLSVGQDTYDTLDEGVSAVFSEDPDLPDAVASEPNTFRTAIVVKGDAFDLTAGVAAGTVQFIQVSPVFPGGRVETSSI